MGSDHCILEITIPIAESTQRAQQQQIVDWHEYREKLEDNVMETIEDIEAWTYMLNTTTKDATQTVEAEPEATMLDSRLAHLMEARNSLRRRWKRQRHNRKLRKRIAQLNRDIEHHSAVLCRQQWHACVKRPMVNYTKARRRACYATCSMISSALHAEQYHSQSRQRNGRG